MSKAPAYLFFGRGLRGGVAGALTRLATKEIPDVHSEPQLVALWHRTVNGDLIEDQLSSCRSVW
jgi:hypothetical protein